MDCVGLLVSWLSYRTVAVCLASVPLTHVFGLYCHSPPSYKIQHLLLFPLTGGNRHLVFQILAWAIWGLSALAILPVLSPANSFPLVPRTHIDVVSGAAAACSFIGELFMLKALLVYDSPEPASRRRAKGMASPEVATALVVFMGLLLSITGGLLLVSIEYMPDKPSRILYCCLSLSCLLIGASSTHGLGGFLRFVKGRGNQMASGASGGWQFFQPFAGGSAFVATQAIGWSLFSATVVCVMVFLQQLVVGVAHCFRCWAYSAGILMILAQGFLGVSLMTWQGRKATKQLMRPSTALSALHQSIRNHLPVFLMYLPVHSFFLAWTITFTFLPFKAAMTLWSCLLIPYYILTSLGEPQHTGCRRWGSLVLWINSCIEESLKHYFGQLKVVRDGTQEVDASGRYIFAFHPHGYYPTGAGFLPLMPSFKRLFPGLNPVTLTASIMYYCPGIKDICCWAGFRQVTRRTFVKALREARSVVMCPGGQAEMVHTYKAFREQAEVVLHVRHKGFCRIAIEEQAAVVPVLALGEMLQLRNAIDCPQVQQYTYRRLGFPFPYLMVGRFGFLPVPRKVPLHYILGDPIHPPPHTPGTPVDAEAVDQLHSSYVKSLTSLFEKHKEDHPVLKDAALVLAYD